MKTMAKKLNLSIPYLSDIENNRRYPPTSSKIEVLAQILKLSTKEQDFLNDLAGKARATVSPDLVEYIMDWEISSYVRTALRKAKQNALTIKDWKRIIKEIDNIRFSKPKFEKNELTD